MRPAPTEGGAGGTGRARADDVLDAVRVRQLPVLLRPAMLAFSVPYLWTWTAGLPGGARIGATAAHGLVVALAGVLIEARDADEGVPGHLRVVGHGERPDATVARLLRLPLTAAALVASLPLLSISALLPAGVAAAVAALWAWMLLPPTRRYHVIPEVVAPLVGLVLPALLLAVVADTIVAWEVVVAGACFLAALLLAMHIRDRRRDLSYAVPTSATRNLPLARGWMLTLAFAGTIAGIASLEIPVSGTDVLRAAGSLGFGVASTIAWHRSVTLAIAHGLFALSLLL